MPAGGAGGTEPMPQRRASVSARRSSGAGIGTITNLRVVAHPFDVVAVTTFKQPAAAAGIGMLSTRRIATTPPPRSSVGQHWLSGLPVMQSAGSRCGRPVSHVAVAGRACVMRSGQAVYGFQRRTAGGWPARRFTMGRLRWGLWPPAFPFRLWFRFAAGRGVAVFGRVGRLRVGGRVLGLMVVGLATLFGGFCP